MMYTHHLAYPNHRLLYAALHHSTPTDRTHGQWEILIVRQLQDVLCPTPPQTPESNVSSMIHVDAYEFGR